MALDYPHFKYHRARITWMFHAQTPPPTYAFNPDVPGITWVDLVFPFFLLYIHLLQVLRFWGVMQGFLITFAMMAVTYAFTKLKLFWRS